MKILVYGFSILLLTVGFPSFSQEDEEEDYDVVVFSTLMGDVIDNVGQERIDAVDVALASFDNPNTYQPDHLSIPSLYFFKARELTFQGKYEEKGYFLKVTRYFSLLSISVLALSQNIFIIG
ncbi:MAG: hypothetical protein KI790_08705 [Cyclobacteriaceae bacterium]|nr:hypothetical protein [Cyclobacteriaceae bacterium HetDA_MAG_MS6]